MNVIVNANGNGNHASARFVQLKTLAIVLKNLFDPSKGGADGDAGLKYRTLKLDNPKIKARLFCSSQTTVRDLLTDASLVGMTIASSSTPSSAPGSEEDDLLVLQKAPSASAVDVLSLRVLPAVTTAQARIGSQLEAASGGTAAAAAAANHSKKPRLGSTRTNGEGTTTTTTTTTPSVPFEQLSEKQKARRLLEEKKRLEKEQDKLHRQTTRAQIRADKHVRLHDENWKPTVSAAADKSGTGLQTFRDRHGE